MPKLAQTVEAAPLRFGRDFLGLARRTVFRFEAVGDVAMLGLQRQVGPTSLELQQGREIDIAQALPDQADHQLVGERRHREGNVELAGGVETELEVLAEKVARKGRGEVQVDEGRRLVAAEEGP